MHGSVRHQGWQYEVRDPEVMTRTQRLDALRDKLQKAVAEEAFELAASLRDEIRGLE